MGCDRRRLLSGKHLIRLLAWVCAVLATLHGPSSFADTLIPLFPPASGTIQGFVRVVNHSGQTGVVRIVATDDAGTSYPPVSLSIAAGETVHFNSNDLESGNTSKGLAGSTGSGAGNWRLQLASDLNFDAMAYIRTPEGFLTSMHDLAPAQGDGRRHRIAIFNPASNQSQVSWLRLINPGGAPAAVVIAGTDDRGSSPGSAVRLTLDAGVSRTLSAQALESGDGVEGALGDGQGKWALTVEADQPIHAMSLLASRTGHATNLSRVPPGRNTFVPLFPAAGRSIQGFVRIVNHSDRDGEVRIVATDDTGTSYPPTSLSIAAGATAHVNSDDLEFGNPSKGLSDGVGAGDGDWRLRLASELEVEALAYIRTKDGFLTSMHDLAPTSAGRRRIATFNPGSNQSQVSSLRLINPGDAPATVDITGTDDRGSSPGSVVRLTLAAGASRTLSVQELESGDEDGVAGALGDGQGKWALTVEADHRIHALSLLSSPTGHLTNLSTIPERRVDGFTNDLAILQPVEGTVYQGQNDVPLVLEFAPDISLLEISDESGALVYRAAGLESPWSSFIRSAELVHGENQLALNAQFENGSSTSTSFTVTMQKEPDPASRLDTSVLFRVEPSGLARIADEIHPEVTERVRFMIANTYTDEFVETCADETPVDISNTGILSADRNEITAVSPGTTRVSLACGPHTHRITVNVNEPTLTSIRIEPDYLLMLGVGAQTEITVTELWSSGQAKPSQAAAITVEDARLLSINGRTVTALRPGRTSLAAGVGDTSDEVDVDIVADIGRDRGSVTVRGGGVLADRRSFGRGTVSGKLILRPDTASQDGEFQFELLDPATFPDIADGETAIASFDVAPSVRFERDAIVRIENSSSVSRGTLVSLSRLDDPGSVHRRTGWAVVSDAYIEVRIPRGGTYVLHAPRAALPTGKRKHVQALDLKNEAAFICGHDLYEPQQSWPDNCDLSAYDIVTSELLRKYRPVLRVKGKDGRESLPGEVPIRISDLIRQGDLVDLQGLDKRIDYLREEYRVEPEHEEKEKKTKELLSYHNHKDMELEIQKLGIRDWRLERRDWRSFKGIPTVYGRIIRNLVRYGSDELTFMVLQYWMYYAGSTVPGGIRLWHEGDVEFFQVLLREPPDGNGELEPVGASSGQHYYGESRHWSEVEKTEKGNPVIYIAYGSHATHFDNNDAGTARGNLRGFLAREGNAARSILSDSLKDSEITITPSIIQESSDSIFFKWQGRFGEFRTATIQPDSEDGPPAPFYRGPGGEFSALSMFRQPVLFHFTYLLPGSHFAGILEPLSKLESRGATDSSRKKNEQDAILRGACLTEKDNENLKVALNMGDHLHGIFYRFGRKNWEFQQYTIDKRLACENGPIDIFFNRNFGAEDTMGCLYHEEYISDPYRRYVAGGIADIDDPLDLAELFEEVNVRSNCSPGLTISEATAVEGDSLEFTVTLDREPDRRVSYYYGTYEGSAGNDGLQSRISFVSRLDFNRGELVGTIEIPTREDTQVEQTETVYLYITDKRATLPFRGPPTTYLAKATGTIVDDDRAALPKVSISGGDAEEGDSLIFTVKLDREPDTPVTFYYATYRQSAGGGDYKGHDATELTFGKREMSRTITVDTYDDTRDEDDEETFGVYITDEKSKLTSDTPVDYLAMATGTIRDNDEPSGPMPRISGGEAQEGDSIDFTVTLDHAPADSVTYWYATYRGSADGEDYTGHYATELTFDADRTRTTRTFTVHTTEDPQFESDEEFYVYVTAERDDLTGGEPTRYIDRATGIIRNDDEFALPSLRISEGEAEEGEQIEFTVELDREPAEGVTYYYATYRVSAGGGDYTGHFATGLWFGAGQTSRTVTVRTAEDEQVEPDETFYLYITDAPDKLPFHEPPSDFLARAIGTIRDNDGLVVNIPDAARRVAVEAALNKSAGAPITRAEMATLTRLEAEGQGIQDLTGLEYATGLVGLDLGRSYSPIERNLISDVSALSGLTALRWLNLTYNRISDVSALSGLTALTRLDLYGNRISDVSALSGLTALTWLDLQNNRISDVSALSGLTALTVLDLDDNRISDVSALSGLTALRSLDLNKNQISDVSALSGLTALTNLELGNNRISDVSALSGLTALTWLRLDGNRISDVSALSDLTALWWLELHSNRISDVSALSGLTTLTVLLLYDNQISDVSALSGLTALTVLGLDDNQISDVSALSGLTALTELYLGINRISDVSALSGLTALTVLGLDDNQISDIGPLIANQGLGNGDTVYLRNNPLSAESRNRHIPALRARGVNIYK